MKIRKLMESSLLWVASAGLSGCYAYTYVAATPPPGAHVSLDLTDQARADLAEHIGPSVLRIDGWLTAVTDSVVTLRVEQTVGIAGNTMPWSGEEVSLKKSYIGLERTKSFSPSRTALLCGALAAGFVGFLAKGGLGGGGSDIGGSPPPVGQ